ncbi:MAG TPA: hypothetical protein VHA14_09315, partial [Bryobacteraceae bacterium]|nr:hypothetical protein [Bryobacteraceae bacterium]
EGVIEKVLRDFKASVESRARGGQGAVRMSSEKIGPGTATADMAKTGTFGEQPHQVEPRFGASPRPATTPPEIKR